MPISGEKIKLGIYLPLDEEDIRFIICAEHIVTFMNKDSHSLLLNTFVDIRHDVA